jgi:hypothetical protein
MADSARDQQALSARPQPSGDLPVPEGDLMHVHPRRIMAAAAVLAAGVALAGTYAGGPAGATPRPELTAAGGWAAPAQPLHAPVPARTTPALTGAARLRLQADGVVVVNSASVEGASRLMVASGAFLTVYTSTPVTAEPARSYPFPSTTVTPGGLSVGTDSCGAVATNLPILFAGPSGSGGTQINVYYPNAYQGGRNVEPFSCAGFDTTRFTVRASTGATLSTLTRLARVQAGIFTANGGGTGVPAGYHLNAVTGAQTPLTSCDADTTGRACPVSTGGVQNFLIVFTTGAEMLGCPDPTIACTLSFGRPAFLLNGVRQGLTFFGWAGFLGQEQANIQIAAGTGFGTYGLSIQGPSFFPDSGQALPVKLGRPN